MKQAPAPRIVDVVFAPRPEPRLPSLPAGLVLAVLLHGGLVYWAASSGPSLSVWAARMQQAVRAELSREQTVEILPPPAPTPPPVVEKAAEPPPPAPVPVEKHAPKLAAAPKEAPRHDEPPHAEPPAPAQAGAIVAQEESADAPVDLTENTFVTGKASTYAGGVTSSKGTNKVEVKTRNVAPNGVTGVGTAPTPAPRPAPVATGPDRSSAVELLEDDWSCPWPREADDEQIDEQTAIVRVTVSRTGQVSQVSLVQDPGYGFGRAAVSCALKARFAPARDRSGQPVDSTSPPIRVHFFR